MSDRMLLVLRLDQGLSWKETAEVLSAEGETADVNALTKRFERLKERLARMAREEGLI